MNDIQVYTTDDLISVAEGYIKSEAVGLALPKNYDWKNAVAALYLQCVGTKTKDGQPVLEACTKESICRTVQEMLTKGLNPSKKQCYAIPYAVKDKESGAVLCWELQLQASYFGKKKEVYTNNPDVVKNSIHSQCIYKDDVFEYEIKDGKRIVTTHKQRFENIKDDFIVGAYATVRFKDGSSMSDIMTTEEIKKSWAMSRAGTAVHAKFTHEMCCKTVEGRLAKHLSNSTDDMAVFGEIEEEQPFEQVIRVEEVQDADYIVQEPAPEPEPLGKDESEPTVETQQETVCTKCGKKISAKAYDYSMQAYGKALCFSCQKEEKEA